MTSQLEAVAELAQRRLRPYCILAGSDDYDLAPHIELLIEYLEALERGDIRRLMVFTPPQNSKSTHVSQRFPAWFLGRHPEQSVILASYGQELASRNGRIVRGLLRSERWPFTVSVAHESSAVHRWNTSAGGGLIAVGVGGGLTGNPGNLIVIDDPHKDREEADSPLMRQRVWDWWTDVVQTRRAPNARELLTLTRWHEDDLAGRILASPDAADWAVLSLPAIAEEGDQLGRAPGAPLWPSRYPLEWLEATKRNTSARSWSALYQQQPVPDSGATFRREWFERRWQSLPPERERRPGTPATPWRIVQFIDSAWDKGVGHDRSAIATWGTDGADFFIIHCWADQVEFPDLQAEAVRHFEACRWRPSYVFVEDKANGRPLIQQLRRTRLADGTSMPVVPITPHGSKEARAEATTPLFVSGHVYLPPDNPAWLDPWIDEHLRFPLGTHDDRVDTTSGALLALAPHLAQAIGLKISIGGEPLLTPQQQVAQKLRKEHGAYRGPAPAGPSRVAG